MQRDVTRKTPNLLFIRACVFDVAFPVYSMSLLSVGGHEGVALQYDPNDCLGLLNSHIKTHIKNKSTTFLNEFQFKPNICDSHGKLFEIGSLCTLSTQSEIV